jgi:hypothetical protein
MRFCLLAAGLAVTLCGMSNLAGAQTPASPPVIKVLGAYYGLNAEGQHYVDAKHSVAVNCDGQVQCHYKVDIDVLGDPARGAAKDFRVAYSCGETVWVGYVEGDASDQPALLLTCEPRKPGPFKAP